VQLQQGDEIEFLRADRGLKAAAIVVHLVTGVPFGEPEI